MALLGPSGCGKSTLLNIIGGLLPATSGRVYFEGEPREGRPLAATVFQEFALFPWRTVRANVEFGLEELGVSGFERAERSRSARGNEQRGLGLRLDQAPDAIAGLDEGRIALLVLAAGAR